MRLVEAPTEAEVLAILDDVINTYSSVAA